MSEIIIAEEVARKIADLLLRKIAYYDFGGDVFAEGKKLRSQEEARLTFVNALLPAPEGTARTADRLAALEAVYVAARTYFDAPDSESCDVLLKAIEAVPR